MKLYILAVSLCVLGALGSAVEGKRSGINPADLIVVGENTYYVSPPDVLENAFGATSYCSGDGMRLVSFEAEEKWLGFHNYMVSNTTYGEDTFWTSLEWFGTGWRWGTGQFADYFAWAPNEPSDSKDGSCVRFVASVGWYVEKCEDTVAAFICEV